MVTELWVLLFPIDHHCLLHGHSQEFEYTVVIAILHWCFCKTILLKLTLVVKLECFLIVFPLATIARFDLTVDASMDIMWYLH